MKKQVKLFNDNFNEKITDIPRLLYLDYEEENVEVQANTLENKVIDGVLLGPTTFGPFNLVLNFSYKGHDRGDLLLMKQRLRNIMFKREPYYVWHSDEPGKKYAVYCTGVESENLTNYFATFKVTFSVYKGYSESLKDTLSTDFLTNEWQFGNGLITDKSITYKPKGKRFAIYNGSTDTIDPIQHNLNISITANAPNGFIMHNYHTNEAFTYYGSLKKGQTLTLKGVHPFIGNNRVGVDTDYSWITLVPGNNNIEIEGIGLSDVSSEFQFNFIYR